MPILHSTNTRNVKASIIRYFRDELALISVPAILTSYTIVADRPEKGIVTPSISFDNIPAGYRQRWQGNFVGNSERGVLGLGIMDMSCWASRSNVNWAAQLDIMHQLLVNVYVKANNGISVRDYTTDPANPVTQPYLIRLDDFEVVQTAPDPNPDIQRLRNLVSYRWVNRAS